MNLLETVVDAIWDGFAAEGNACVDREMDLIDTGGSRETFSMERIAEHVIATLGLTEESKYLENGTVSMTTERSGVVKTSGPIIRHTRFVGNWIADSAHTAT